MSKCVTDKQTDRQAGKFFDTTYEGMQIFLAVKFTESLYLQGYKIIVPCRIIIGPIGYPRYKKREKEQDLFQLSLIVIQLDINPRQLTFYLFI